MKIAAALLTALALGLGACGGGGQTTTSATTAPAPAPADTAAEDTETAATGGGGGEYPAAVRENFLSSCEAGSSAEQCECMLEEIEKKVSFDDFAKADAEVAQGGQMPGWAAEAQQACT